MSEVFDRPLSQSASYCDHCTQFRGLVKQPLLSTVVIVLLARCLFEQLHVWMLSLYHTLLHINICCATSKMAPIKLYSRAGGRHLCLFVHLGSGVLYGTPLCPAYSDGDSKRSEPLFWLWMHWSTCCVTMEIPVFLKYSCFFWHDQNCIHYKLSFVWVTGITPNDRCLCGDSLMYLTTTDNWDQPVF